MENFENGEIRQPEQPSDSLYSGAGAGRKESPFADSPYVMNHNTDNTYHASAYQQNYNQSNTVPPVEPPKQKKKKEGTGKAWKNILAAVLTVALVASGCGITAALVNRHWEAKTEDIIGQVNVQIMDLQRQIEENSNASTGNSVSGTVSLTGGLTPAQVYAQNAKSVVLISCSVTTSYFGQSATGTSAGSGFVLTEDGYMMTNAHVVDGANTISVTMYDGTVYEAELIGKDTVNDVAVIKVDATGLPAVTVGSSTALIVGDQVVAIGNPLGELTSTMTVGYISAKDRDVTTDGTTINMLQTDVAINSGNSGGPLFNMNGEVVGITTAKYSGESSSGASIEGIGFAIPIDDVLPLADDLIHYGYVTGAYLGIMVSDMDSETANYYGLPVGAYVQEVTAGYAAEAAGLQAKDIIVALGDYEVGSVSDLTRVLRNFKAGDTTSIVVYRNGGRVTLSITMDEKPQTTTETEESVQPEGEMPQDGSYDEWYNYFSPFFGNGRG